ncbi:hypothetical protein D3C84_927060 [compost metagenome]
MHHRRHREYITGFDDGIHEAGFDRPPDLGIIILGLTSAVVGHDVNRTAGTGSAVTRVELDPQHGECIDTNAYGTFGEAGLEPAHDSMGPLLGKPVTGATRLAFAEIAIEVQIAVEDGEAAALNEAFWFWLIGHCAVPNADTQRNER